jgi:site-specific recombinase XerC
MRKRKRSYRPPVEADDTTPVITLRHLRLRNRAIAILYQMPLSAAEIAELRVGDVDLDGEAVRSRGRVRPLDGGALYCVECHLDMLRDASAAAPLFVSRRLQRLSSRQVRRVV